MWIEAPETHGEGIWALAAAMFAHLLAVLHERSTEKKQKNERAERLCTLIHTEIKGLLETFKDKRFFIETHWQDSLSEETSVFEASPIITDTLDRLYTEVVVLSEDTVKLFSLALRRIKVMVNEYSETSELPSYEVRSKLALRVYNLCIVEKTLCALDRSLEFEISTYQYRQEPFYKRWFGMVKRARHPSLPSTCNLCGRSGFSSPDLLECDNPHLVLPGQTTMRPASEIHCASPLLVEIRDMPVSIEALAGKTMKKSKPNEKKTT